MRIRLDHIKLPRGPSEPWERYLTERNGVFHVIVPIPKSLQHLAGKRRFQRSLHTRNRKKAEELAGPWQRKFRAEIKALRSGAATKATDATPLTVRAAADEWHESTRRHHGHTAVDRFIAWAGTGTTVAEVDKGRAQRFANGLRSDAPSERTARRVTERLVDFWRWLELRGYAASNPWRAVQHRKWPRSARALTDAELTNLLADKPLGKYGVYQQVVCDLIRLVAVTGAEWGELLAAARDDFERHGDGWWVRIGRAAKGRKKPIYRYVPLHGAVDRVAERRHADGWLGAVRSPINGRQVWAARLSRTFTKRWHGWNATREKSATPFAATMLSLRANFKASAMGCGMAPEMLQALIGDTPQPLPLDTEQRRRMRDSIGALAYSPDIIEAIGRRGVI